MNKSCWTCRIRRKKCDGVQPVCNSCAALNITCYNRLDKPQWMDGGAKQDEMAARIKREVKENAPRRRERRSTDHSDQDLAMGNESHSAEPTSQPKLGKEATSSMPDMLLPIPEAPPIEVRAFIAGTTNRNQQNSDGSGFAQEESIMSSTGWSNNVLLMFYLDNVVPFLFPLYRPSLHRDGGRAWILEMVFKSPAIRQAILCQASVFYALTQGSEDLSTVWDTIMKHTGDAFAMLRQALQVRLDTAIPVPPHCTARLIAAVLQLSRFEMATLSFENCQQHLNAALELFERLLDSYIPPGHADPHARFDAVLQALRPTELETDAMGISSAECAAFRFSSALLIVDDIVASTILQEPPRLIEYHESILGNKEAAKDCMNLETIIGCQNWVFLELGKIAALDAWRQRCRRAGNLDIMELARQAMSIRDSLQQHIKHLVTDPLAIAEPNRAMMDLFTADYLERTLRSVGQISVVTRVWAHASMIYLLLVVSGWQPASPDIRYHVDWVLELLIRQLTPPALLRTLVWPLCVAGCLAEPVQEARIRGLVDVLRPSAMFGTIHKALDIMESVWATRDSPNFTNRDIATCLRSQGDLILLV